MRALGWLGAENGCRANAGSASGQATPACRILCANRRGAASAPGPYMTKSPYSPRPALMIALTIAACGRAPAHQPVRGFPADAIAALAQRESLLVSTPDTARLRSYMRAMTEEPH